METIADLLSSIGAWTLRNSLETCVLVALVAGIAWFGRGRVSPRFLAALWIMVGIRLMLPFAPESAFSLFNLAPGFEGQSSLAGPVETDTLVLPADAISARVELTKSTWNPDLSGLIAGAWILGALGILGAAVSRQIRTCGWVRDLVESEEPILHRLLRQCSEQAGVRRRPRLVESSRVTGIALFGWLQPTHLIIPEGFSDRYSESEIRGMFLHELAHVRRGDLFWNWVTLLLQAIHWFNPLVWWAGRQFRMERELICDRFALTRLSVSEHRDYGSALLKTLEFRNFPAGATPAFVPFSSVQSERLRRLAMISKSPAVSPVFQTVAAILAVGAGVMTFTSAPAEDGESNPASESSAADESPATIPGDESATGKRIQPENEIPSARRGDDNGGGGSPAARRGGDAATQSIEPVGELTVTLCNKGGASVNGRKITLADLASDAAVSKAGRIHLVVKWEVTEESVAIAKEALAKNGVDDLRIEKMENPAARKSVGAPEE